MTEDMQVRNFAPSTQFSYLYEVSRFARYFGKSPSSSHFGNATLDYVMAGPRAGHPFPHKPAVKSPETNACAAIGGRDGARP
jgi:hypothetical protein